ncbi:MAG: efflux RND transporter permease subunit [Proteobacteria bacterium]|nr:efflux RND transporter permease subunit [Pseudomonadota bacterium]
MRITSTAIQRGVTFFMIYLIAVGFGLFSLGRLKVDLYPDLTFPMISIITQYTGVGPFDMENVVTRPIEEVVASVKNVKTITSNSRQGLSLIMLEFDWGTDMNQAETDVRNVLDFVDETLPDDTTDPMVFSFDPSMQPIIFFTVGSKVHGMAELRRISEIEIEPRLERIPGVASAATMGGLKREIKVLVDPVRLHAHHASIAQVQNALRMNNMQLPSGWIEDKEREFTIQTLGEYRSIEEIEETAIAVMEGSVLRIKDVADVVDGFTEQRQRVWTNGAPAVILMVQRQSDANTLNVSNKVREQLPQILNEIPKGVTVDTVFDQATFINRSMSNLSNTAVQAILLTVLVLLFFLRSIRSSIIIGISIPISMLVTFAVMDQAGITLNMISMAGLALAVGMLVDNSIVVLESIYRHREQGETPRVAADEGAREVAMAITASTLTTVAVFVPVLFVPGIAGELFKDMVITICVSLGASLIIALTLVPLLASRLLKDTVESDKKFPGLKRVGNSLGRAVEKMQFFYIRVLKWSLTHKAVLLISTFLVLLLSIYLLSVRGGEFIPRSDMGVVQMTLDRSAGISLESMEKTVLELSDLLMKHVPESEVIYTSFGQGEGMFAAFASQGSNEGDAMIRLKKKKDRKRSMSEIEDDLRGRVDRIPDLKVAFEDRGAASLFGGSDIDIEIFGHDFEIAKALANTITDKIKGIQGIVNTEISIKAEMPELKIELDRQRVADLGLSTTQIGQTINTCMLGTVATRYREGGDEFDIRVQLKKEARENKSDIENILLMSPGGRQIPLRAVARITYGAAPAEILREDQERKVTVAVDVSGRDLKTTTDEVTEALKSLIVPNDFRVEIGGMAEDMADSFRYLAIAFLVAMALTYMVMASQFESLLDPFVIMFTIPLSIIGVGLALFLTGTTLSVMSLIGVIMLVGIIVNNGIVLVDYANQLRIKGLELKEAICEAGKARLRPVLMTALTTILAMVPLSLGLGESGENWAPMARTVIGGLLMGTVLTLIVVPVMYAILHAFIEKHHSKRQRG